MSEKHTEKVKAIAVKNGARTYNGKPINEFVLGTYKFFEPNKKKGILQLKTGKDVIITQAQNGNLKYYGNNTTALLLYTLNLLTVTGNNRVEINLKEYAKHCGYDVFNADKAEAKKELDKFRRTFNTALRELDVLRLEWVETKGKAKGDYDARHIITGHGLKKGVAYIIVNPDLAEPLIANNYIMSLPNEAFLIGKNAIQTKLLYKLSHHYNNAKNRKSGTNNRLSVATLLEWTELPTLEEMKRQNDRHYYTRILEPLERYLDGFKSDGALLLWEYCEPNLAPLKDTNDKRVIEQALIHFELPTDETPTVADYEAKK